MWPGAHGTDPQIFRGFRSFYPHAMRGGSRVVGGDAATGFEAEAAARLKPFDPPDPIPVGAKARCTPSRVIA